MSLVWYVADTMDEFASGGIAKYIRGIMDRVDEILFLYEDDRARHGCWRSSKSNR